MSILFAERASCAVPMSVTGHVLISLPLDRLRWYCKSGKHEKPTFVREDAFHCTDLGTQLKPVIQNWINNESIRKCPECGMIAEVK